VSQAFDASTSLTALEKENTVIAVIKMSQAKYRQLFPGSTVSLTASVDRWLRADRPFAESAANRLSASNPG
jgi:hypothetical protein